MCWSSRHSPQWYTQGSTCGTKTTLNASLLNPAWQPNHRALIPLGRQVLQTSPEDESFTLLHFHILSRVGQAYKSSAHMIHSPPSTIPPILQKRHLLWLFYRSQSTIGKTGLKMHGFASRALVGKREVCREI